MRWIVLATLVGLAACAAQTPSSVRKAADEQYIEETAVDVPEVAGAAVLVNATRAGTVDAGIEASYRADRLPDGSIDLFIYPAGRMPEETGLDRGTRGFLDSLAEAKQYGVFDDLQVDPTQAFPSVREDDSALGANKVRLRFSRNGAALESRAWIAYKQNYWFKLRMTATPSFGAELDALGDVVARDLFRLARATSKGACSSMTITLPPSPSPQQVLDAATDAMRKQDLLGCVPKDYPETKPGFRRAILPFPPGSWSESESDSER